MYTITGERYKHKQKWIQEWMDKDRRMQELYDNSSPPQKVTCPACHSPMVVTYKDVQDSYEPNARMMYMFECSKCKKRQSLFEDGTEWEYVPPKCPKCKHPLKTDIKIKGDITTFISKCTKCGYIDKSVNDHGKFKREQEEKEQLDRELLEKYRAKFCLSETEGQKYLESIEIMEVAKVVREEEREKHSGPVYERSLQLKKTNITDLEILLTKPLAKSKYIKLSFDKPEISLFVIVPFTIQDADSSRKDRVSVSELEKLMKNSLEDTNWRLLPNSVIYRLGYLEGRLKGYEREEDMLKLAGKTEEVAPKSKVDDAKRQKYAGNNMVHLARLFGELDGIEAIRKRRLEKEPDGFILNDGKSGYTCRICGESMSGDNTWWDLKGIRCLDCQRNLKEGVVPLEMFDDDYGYDVVVKTWELQTYYGIHPATIRKLQRQGILKARELKRKDGIVYGSLFVVSENKEFFNEHPKQKPKINITFSSSEDEKK